MVVRDFTHHIYSWAETLSDTRVIKLPAAAFDPLNATHALQDLKVGSAELGYLYRMSKDLPYCEGRWGGLFYGAVSDAPADHFPERGSVVSAPFILLCGLHMAFTWRHDSGLLHVITALFSVNGIAAFAAHYNGLVSWHNLDGKSMLLAVWLALGFLMSELFENIFRRLGLVGRRAECVRTGAGALVWFTALFIYWWVAETNMAFNVYEIGTRVGAMATALPLVISAFANCCLSCCCARPMRVSMGREAFAAARCRFVFGLTCALVGATMWILTENLCDRDDTIGTITKWFPGHFIWHVAMSYGMVQCLVFGGALRADNFNASVTIDQGTPGAPFRWYFFVFPRLILTSLHGKGSNAIAPAPLPQSDPADGPAKYGVVASPGKRNMQVEDLEGDGGEDL